MAGTERAPGYDERVSLHPLTFDQALERLLDTPAGSEGGEDDERA